MSSIPIFSDYLYVSFKFKFFNPLGVWKFLIRLGYGSFNFLSLSFNFIKFKFKFY